MERISKTMSYHIKVGFLRGIGLGLGLLSTGLLAAAYSLHIFSSGEVISSAKLNQNFAIAAPEGAVMAFYLSDCPDGWTPADGTNGAPDLRGNFIRGSDTIGIGSAGNDPDGSRTIGSLQLDAFQGFQVGAEEDDSGPRNYFGRIAYRGYWGDPVPSSADGHVVFDTN